MHVIKLNNEQFNVAATWNELTTKQMLWLSEHVCLAHNRMVASPLLYYKTKLQLLMQLMDIPKRYLFAPKKVKLFKQMNKEQLADLTLLTDVFFGNSTRTVNPLPTIRIGFKTLTGPLDEFKYLLFGEYIFADTLFSVYSKSRKEADLNNFCAALYRKADKSTNDGREAFNNVTIEERVSFFEKVPLHKKYAIYLFYCGYHEKIKKRYPLTFSKKKSQGKGQKSDLLSLSIAIAGPKFGTHEQTLKTEASIVLRYLENENAAA